MKKLRFVIAYLIAWACANLQAQDISFAHLDANEGLSHNQVSCFFKDDTGFMWIGTNSGLNRFDGHTVKVFVNDPTDTTTLLNNIVTNLFQMPDRMIGVLTSSGLCFYDSESETFTLHSAFLESLKINAGDINNVVADGRGNFWFVFNTSGIALYQTATGGLTIFRHAPQDSTSISTNSISSLISIQDGACWIVHRNGVIEKIQYANDKVKVVYRNHSLKIANKNELHTYNFLPDEDGDIWAFLLDDNRGIYFLDIQRNIVRHFHEDAPAGKLNTNLVSGVVQNNQGLIWVGTDHGGINVIDKSNFSVQYVYHQEENERSLSQNSITSLYKDNEGIIWVGTYKKGVSYYHENIIRFPLFKKYVSVPFSLPYEDVNRFVEDDLGNLWIGTNGGGLIYFNRESGKFNSFRHDPEDPGSLSSDVIVSLLIDHEKKLWIGTYYGGVNCYDGKKFVRYFHNPSNPNSLSSRSMWEIFEDSQNRLWIGTLDAGLDLFDRPSKSFTHYRYGDLNSIQSAYVSAIAEDSEGNLWVGTGNGIDVLVRQTGRFIHYGSEKSNPTSIRNNIILDIREDSNGQLWVATQGGLSLFNKETKSFRTFTKSDGLPHNSVLTILEDGYSNLWLSTPNGISNMIFDKKSTRLSVKFKNYDEGDGLQGKQFNENAAFRTSKGELIFGGANGFNIFKPDQLGRNMNLPHLTLTDFQLFNKSIRPNETVDGEIFLTKSISKTPAITLPADKNVFSIEFVATNFFQPEKNVYKYKLEGFNDDWLYADSKSRRVTFTNLDPGEYRFKVLAANNDGVWNEEGVSLPITVLPPFWRSLPAFFIYGLLLVLALLAARKIIQQRMQMKFAIQQERQEALRLHELDMMKIKFFTNVSHEFRTPLTLILTPLEKLLKHTGEGEQKGQFELMQRNAKRLLNLVNQLLDFRKMEVQEFKFQPSEGDIIKFIRETVYSFSDLSEKKGIRLEFHSSLNSLETIFDQDKLEKILFNLLSNAFKFTAGQGIVEVALQLRVESRHWLEIKVKDNGIGISPDKQDRIFERFFQNELPKSMVNQGSGIGLSITHEFVKVHGGTISVESELGNGSCFTVSLPVKEIAHVSEVVSKESVSSLTNSDSLSESPHSLYVNQKPVLLLVEDNEDFRFYLKDNLNLIYHVIEAKDGLEGWKKVLSHFPDLIVSDVMMPEMNGIEFCKKVKTDQRVSHIPVILLTARTSEEQHLEGLEIGADDYIHKPFNFEILESRIRNLILQRDKLHKAFARQAGIKASELNITSLDEQFIDKAIRCVESNISNADFSVEDLSHEIGISRANFYKKILALTGKSPLEFIRTIRLQQAAQLLEKSQLTVAEVAYKVGFNNPKYFARYFKEAYHVLPSAYAAGKRRI